MKKTIPLLLFLLFVSCKQTDKAQKLYNQACSMFQSTNITEWAEDSHEKEMVINKLNDAIKLKPNWWPPYHEKIQILKIGSLEKNAEQIKDVYNLWLQNNNILEGFSKFSYACSLYCSGNEIQSLEIFRDIFYNFSNTQNNDEEKIMYIFSGIVIGNITENNYQTFVLKIFDNSMLDNIQKFLLLFNESPKEALWIYV